MAEYNWIDDVFRVQKQKWGTWDSYDKEGKCIITSPTEQTCIDATRFYLKGKQDGWEDSQSVKYEGVVGGKL